MQLKIHSNSTRDVVIIRSSLENPFFFITVIIFDKIPVGNLFHFYMLHILIYIYVRILFLQIFIFDIKIKIKFFIEL